jgi:hypothetical protein
MPGPLKNARHERFAQELAKGKSKLGAYTLAGYEPIEGRQLGCQQMSASARGSPN